MPDRSARKKAGKSKNIYIKGQEIRQKVIINKFNISLS